MKIVVWTDSDALAGTERHCLDLGAGLRDAGSWVSIACRPSSPMARSVECSQGRLLALDASGAPLAAVSTLRSLLENGELDVIHSHNGRTTFLACLAVLRAGRGCVVATQHFIAPARVTRRGLVRFVSNRMHRWINARVDRWIAISEAVSLGMLARNDVPRSRLSTIPNGTAFPDASEPQRAQARLLLGLPQLTPVILCVARLAAEKGLEVLLSASAMLIADGVLPHILFVGEGALRERLKCLAQELGLSECVQWLGYQSDPGVWMRAADLLVLPSAEEPFGLVLLEAMSRGIPVIAAAAGGPLEIVDSTCGHLFSPGDGRDLATKIKHLLANPSELRRLGEGARLRWKTHFELGTMVCRIKQAYGNAFGVARSASG